MNIVLGIQCDRLFFLSRSKDQVQVYSVTGNLGLLIGLLCILARKGESYQQQCKPAYDGENVIVILFP